MSEKNARVSADDAAVSSQGAPQTGAPTAEAAPASVTAAAESSAEAHEREAAELKDKVLRVLAEMENLRRRTEREVADARNYGIAGFARDMLSVADNMRRAVDAVPPEVRDGTDIAAKSLLEGVELTERELLKALEKNGVTKFDPLGEKFNPNLHQAMYEVPDETVPAGLVVQVMQPGFMIADRILRPAFVGVSKGGPKTPPPASETPQI